MRLWDNDNHWNFVVLLCVDSVGFIASSLLDEVMWDCHLISIQVGYQVSKLWHIVLVIPPFSIHLTAASFYRNGFWYCLIEFVVTGLHWVGGMLLGTKYSWWCQFFLFHTVHQLELSTSESLDPSLLGQKACYAKVHSMHFGRKITSVELFNKVCSYWRVFDRTNVA